MQSYIDRLSASSAAHYRFDVINRRSQCNNTCIHLLIMDSAVTYENMRSGTGSARGWWGHIIVDRVKGCTWRDHHNKDEHTHTYPYYDVHLTGQRSSDLFRVLTRFCCTASGVLHPITMYKNCILQLRGNRYSITHNNKSVYNHSVGQVIEQ